MTAQTLGELLREKLSQIPQHVPVQTKETIMQFIRVEPTAVYVPIKTQVRIDLSPGMRILLAPLVHPSYGQQPNKILAIKAVRAEFACGLKEAKDIVEGLTRDQLGLGY